MEGVSMNIEDIRENIEKRELFRREGNTYIKTYEYVVDMLVNDAYKYYNLQKIELKEDELLLFSPVYDDPVRIKYSDIEKFYVVGSIF